MGHATLKYRQTVRRSHIFEAHNQPIVVLATVEAGFACADDVITIIVAEFITVIRAATCIGEVVRAGLVAVGDLIKNLAFRAAVEHFKLLVVAAIREFIAIWRADAVGGHVAAGIVGLIRPLGRLFRLGIDRRFVFEACHDTVIAGTAVHACAAFGRLDLVADAHACDIFVTDALGRNIAASGLAVAGLAGAWIARAGIACLLA